MMHQSRRQTPKSFLDASLVPLENALLVRAQAIAAEVLTTPDLPGDSDERAAILSSVRSQIAEEFRKLAEELHYW